jgi:hypothetical protein
VHYYAYYDYSPWFAKQVSENGSAKPHAKPIEFTRLTVWQYAGREGLLYWTIVAMTGFRTHPEHSPNQSVYAEVVCRPSLYRSFLSLCYRRSVIRSRGMLPSCRVGNDEGEGSQLGYVALGRWRRERASQALTERRAIFWPSQDALRPQSARPYAPWHSEHSRRESQRGRGTAPFFLQHFYTFLTEPLQLPSHRSLY